MILLNIKKLCVAKGLSIHQLEIAAGIGNGVIAGWEKRSPRVDKLKSVADILQVSVDDLLRDEAS